MINENRQRLGKKAVIVIIMLAIAAVHILHSSETYKGPFAYFMNCYMFDIIVPFGFYFLLCLIDYSLFKFWIFRALLVFLASSSVEIAQYFGAHIFGSTFDPVDFIMFAIGVIAAVIFDVVIFPRILKFWVTKSA